MASRPWNVYPADLLAPDHRVRIPPPPPEKGQELVVIRFGTVVTNASASAQPVDARLYGEGMSYRCHEASTWCRGEGCGAAFVFYVPKGASLDRFELGSHAVPLAPRR
jgi:hypothetical protein